MNGIGCEETLWHLLGINLLPDAQKKLLIGELFFGNTRIQSLSLICGLSPT